MPATIEVIVGDPYGLVPALLRKGAQTAQSDPALGGVVLSSGTDEFTSPAVCEDGAGGSLTGACSLGPSGARGHGVVVHTDPSGHIVGIWTINPTANPPYYGSGLALTVNGPNAVVAVSQHQAQTPPRLSQVALAIIPNVVTVSGGGGGGGVTMEQVNAAIAAALAGIQGGGGVTSQDKLDVINGVLDGLSKLLAGQTYRGADDPNLAHEIRAGFGGLMTSATQAAVTAAGVLTAGNLGQTFYADPKVYARISETAYESDVNAEKAEKP
jgi:hypothetical protein